jgi:predicted metal-dependent hydrolase
VTSDPSLPGLVIQGGRAKAYRPMPANDRAAALAAGLAAYDRGDYFEAHELLEPAWMGAADPHERDLHQGLIKLAAAYVHAVRGNPLGMAKNLSGARDRLQGVGASVALEVGGAVDVSNLLDEIERRLVGTPDPLTEDPPTIRRTQP